MSSVDVAAALCTHAGAYGPELRRFLATEAHYVIKYVPCSSAHNVAIYQADIDEFSQGLGHILYQICPALTQSCMTSRQNQKLCCFLMEKQDQDHCAVRFETMHQKNS